MRGYVRTSAHGRHHELYSPAHNAMCKRWDTPLTPLQSDFDLIHDPCRCPLCPSHVLSSFCAVTTRMPLSRGLCFQPIVMMQATQDRPHHHAQVLGKAVPVCLQQRW